MAKVIRGLPRHYAKSTSGLRFGLTTGSAASFVTISNRALVLAELRRVEGGWVARRKLLRLLDPVGVQPLDQLLCQYLTKLRADIVDSGEMIEVFDARVRLLGTAAIKVARIGKSPLTTAARPTTRRFYGSLHPRAGR